MMKLSPREAFLLLTHKDASRIPLIDALIYDSSYTDYALKLLNDYDILNIEERAYLIKKMKHIHILLTQIQKNRFNSIDRKTVLERCLLDNNHTYSFINVVESLSTEEQKLIIPVIIKTPFRMVTDILTLHSNKFNDIYINELRDVAINNPEHGITYLKKFPDDIKRRELIINDIAKRGGKSMNAFFQIIFSQEERSKLLKTIVKYKSYTHELLIGKHYGPYLTEEDKQAIIDSLLISKNLDVAKLVNDNVSLKQSFKDKIDPILVMGKLVGTI
jgi:hypothetical protein